MSEILGLEEAKINENISSENVVEWDSLKHMKLVLALEEEFGIQIADDDIPEMLDYMAIVKVINKILNNDLHQ